MCALVEGNFTNSAPAIPSVNDSTGRIAQTGNEKSSSIAVRASRCTIMPSRSKFTLFLSLAARLGTRKVVVIPEVQYSYVISAGKI